jgi:hypothetical protein
MVAFNGLTPSNSKAKCDQRRYSRLSFQQTPKKRLHAKTKTPCNSTELQVALSVHTIKLGI